MKNFDISGYLFSPLAGAAGGAARLAAPSRRAAVAWTRDPLRTFWTPSATIVSAGFQPLSMIHRDPIRSAGVTVRTSTTLSAPTTR